MANNLTLWAKTVLASFVCEDVRKENDQLTKQLETLQTSHSLLLQTNDELSKLYRECDSRATELEQHIARLNKQNDLETYWNTKRPQSDGYTYKARPSYNTQKMLGVDPRVFFNIDASLPKAQGKTNDEIARNAQLLTMSMVQYVGDDTSFKLPEVWLFAFETKQLGKGDCEDGAILMANIMLNSGIPYWRIRLNGGRVKIAETASGGGHCWVTYLRESDNQWVVLDWCYDPQESLRGLLYKDAEHYFEIWFSFNQRHVFLSENFDRGIK